MRQMYWMMAILPCLLFQTLFFSLLLSEELNNQEGADAVNQTKPLHINIISWSNGVGLEQDVGIMYRELKNLGHIVHAYDVFGSPGSDIVDINIFIELVNSDFFSHAHQNYLMPNPDWYSAPIHELPNYDKILCKTEETYRIFKQFSDKCVFTGFTSGDRYDPLVTKDYKACLHLAGASQQKNSNEVAATWRDNPHFPLLRILKCLHGWDVPPIPNVELHYRYFDHDELVFNQNVHGFHICTSGMEGFGHYIMEGLGCGGVVVTLDAPPMNEFVRDPRCLVPVIDKMTHYLADFYFFELSALAKVMENLFSLPEEELKEMGRKNREFYLENDRLFKARLAEIFPPAQ
jgi:hypothetical protein